MAFFAALFGFVAIVAFATIFGSAGLFGFAAIFALTGALGAGAEPTGVNVAESFLGATVR